MSAYWYEQLREDAPDGRLLSRRSQMARKERVCSDCGRTIRVGEQYTRDAFIYDGEFGTRVAHTSTGMCMDYVLPGEPGYDELEEP